MTAAAYAFDALAADYDAQFTASTIGRLMRQAVWRRLDTRFHAGDRVLELNCGTGEDAVYLGQRGVQVLATDQSSAMVQITRQKVAQAGLVEQVQVQQLALEHLHELEALPFGGALSNFGGLNCVADVGVVAHALARHLRPGAVAVLCVMGPMVPWEWLWFLARGQPAQAFRRLHPGGIVWRGLTIRYPSIRRLRRAFAPAFRPQRISAIGALLPPPYTEHWTARHLWLLERLNQWERGLETLWPLPWLADHYLVEFVRL